MKIFLIILGCLIGLLLIGYLFIFFFAGSKMRVMLKKSDKKISSMKGMDVKFYDEGPMRGLANKGLEFMDTLEKEEFTMTSFDGYKLHAFYFKNPYQETNKYFLGMHGFKSGPLHEYAPYIKYYFDLGFNVIVPDERAHYRSEGKYITMGCNERIDTVDWTKFIVNKFGSDIEILIQGVSMGAASVCLASSLDLPKQVIGIISDCAYSSFDDIIEHMLKNFGNFNPKFVINMLRMYLKIFMKMDFKKHQPVESVKVAKVPMLFVHGKLDQIVPVDCSYKLYKACGSKKKLYIVEEANHAESIGRRGIEYINTVKDFFNL